jgi:iron complex transport system substrate-binding protein
MIRFLTIYVTVFIAIVLFSCSSKRNKDASEKCVKTFETSYANGFEIRYYDEYKEVIVNNPWADGLPMERYYLVKDKKTEVPPDGQKIIIPLQSLGVASCTHFEFLYMLHEEQSITGVCSPELVYNADITGRYKAGKLVNLGDAFDLNFEQILFLHPNAVMVSGINQLNEKEKRISQAGVPVIYNNEWTETSLLARAEWIKFVSAFYDKEQEADSIFAVIESNYTAIKKIAQQVAAKPTVLPGSNFKGTWYVPGGKSYMGQLFLDAGTDYFYRNDTTKTSLPLSFEMVLKEFGNADYWVGCSANSMEELLRSDERYALFNATKTGNVYNFNRRTTPTGGNDFWEGAVAHPDWVLSDLIGILHPDLLPEYALVYMKKLD